MIFAVFDLSPLTVCINCSILHLYLLFYCQFWVDIFCHSLCDCSDFWKINTRLRHHSRTSVRKVSLVEIRALWRRARWASREEHIRPSNCIGLDIYFNSIWQICIPTSELSACAVSVFLADPFCTSENWTVVLTPGRNEHQISLADRVWYEMHYRAKCRQNPSISYGDIAIFRFLKIAAAAILDFRNSQILLAEGF